MTVEGGVESLRLVMVDLVEQTDDGIAGVLGQASLLADVGLQMGGCRRGEVGPIVRVDGDDFDAREVRSDLATDPPEEPVEIIGVLARLIVATLGIGVSLSSSIVAVARRYVAVLSGLVPIGGELIPVLRAGLELGHVSALSG
jgi:hypothetical protein